jgi:hypothetical protein
MNDLLDRAVAAHGGLDRWNRITSVTFDASIGGAFWPLKGQGDALKDVRLEVATTRQLVTMELAGQGRRYVFEPLRVVVQHDDGSVIQARENPDRSFDGHRFDSPWDDVQLAYFVGEAQWTYLTMPFLYTWPGFASDEIAPIEVDGETWRRLRVAFPEGITSHTREQIACFGPDGLLRRHDFTMDILGGAPGSLYATGYRDIDGIILPTTRRAYAPQGDTRITMIAIDMDNIVVR